MRTFRLGLGLWLCPAGDCFQVEQKHVTDLISNAEKFGISKDIVDTLYQQHNEPVGKEEKAREELIALVLSRGWVRIRNYPNHWSVTVLDPSTAVVDNIRNWVAEFIKRGLMGTHADIKVFDMNTTKSQAHDAIDIVKKHALEETTNRVLDTSQMLTDQQWSLYQALSTPDPIVVFFDPDHSKIAVHKQTVPESQHNLDQPHAIKLQGIQSLIVLRDKNGKKVAECHRANFSAISQHCTNLS